MSLNRPITSEILIAYSQCPRKAFLVFCTDEKGTPHEYVSILERHKETNRRAYLRNLKQKIPSVQDYDISSLQGGSDMLINATLKAEGFEVGCDLLTKVEASSSLGTFSYEPTICVGTHTISQEQRLELFFAGYVLGQIQGKVPAAGRIIVMGQRSREVKLENCGKTLMPLLEDLQEWAVACSPEPPPLILSKHCPLCQFHSLCRVKAEQEDHLSLLDQISTPKAVQQYEKKGIFTVKQLSYLYKPRRRKKRTRNPPKPIYKPELQALAIRTGKIYLQELPELSRQPIELFLDIEGIPDQQLYYLIGLLVCEANTCEYHSFWADSSDDEAQIWKQFLAKANEYPGAPIYHYGSYEPRAIAKLSRRYDTEGESLKSRLVNVNALVYARVYFPVRSNRLKEIGGFLGMTWTAPDASGLQSLVWRHHWDETRDTQYRSLLVTYNNEDCQALKLLADELSKITQSANTLSEVDFVEQPKRHATDIGTGLHDQLEAILKLSHADYDRKRISLQPCKLEGNNKKEKRGARKGHPGHTKMIPEPDRVIHVPPMMECPEHKGELLEVVAKTFESTIIDLTFTRSGIEKTITKYVGKKSYCWKCLRLHSPPELASNHLAYGHGFRAWVVYHRLFLRLPYRVITQSLMDQFDERMSEGTISNFLTYFGNHYGETEHLSIRSILRSSFIHVDETKVNIQGVEQYAWVFTDGSHVVFRLTETREAAIVHEILADYDGVLISDFYPGYDAVQCRQQKCWGHLIRDLNDDLWKAPFDGEFEVFVLEIRNLVLPIFQAVEQCGLESRHLGIFRESVDQFYQKTVAKSNYKSELSLKYQKRFVRYRESLFTVLEYDGIPWNNNMAERALRQLAVQRKISGTFFQTIAHHYLLLLGIMQTCRLQNKSFLRFLLSGERDIDQFE